MVRFVIRFIALAAIILVCSFVPAVNAESLEETHSKNSSIPVDNNTSQKINELLSLTEKAKNNPDSADNKKAIEYSIESGLPSQIPYSLLKDLPLDISEIDNHFGYIAVERPYLPVDAKEPQSNVPYPRVCYIYMPQKWAGTSTPSFISNNETESGDINSDDLVLFCRIHYTDAEYSSLSQRIGCLLLLSRYLLVYKTGHMPNNGYNTIDVWLSQEGSAGGEQWGNNIYFDDLPAQRSSIEWIREITHEYSHLAIPPIGGYDAPEYWANGYIGERLIIRWLKKTPGCENQVTNLWGDFSGYTNFNKLLITPSLALYKRIGPNNTWQTRKDEEGMRYIIGQILTIDDKYGPRVLGDVFNRLPRLREAKPYDIIEAVSTLSLPKPAGAKHTKKHVDISSIQNSLRTAARVKG